MDSKMDSKRWPRRSKMGPKWAKMRTRHEKMSPINVAIAGRFAVFAKHVLKDGGSRQVRRT